jgi:hypothetical protein
LLKKVALGVTTSIFPVVAPAGTVVVISVAETTVKTAGMPLKLTLVAPVKSVPRILTRLPIGPNVGTDSTKGFRPTDKLKMSPLVDGWLP